MELFAFGQSWAQVLPMSMYFSFNSSGFFCLQNPCQWVDWGRLITTKCVCVECLMPSVPGIGFTTTKAIIMSLFNVSECGSIENTKLYNWKWKQIWIWIQIIKTNLCHIRKYLGHLSCSMNAGFRVYFFLADQSSLDQRLWNAAALLLKLNYSKIRYTNITSSFTRFQACLYFAAVFQATSCGIHYLASVFLVETPKFLCDDPWNITDVLYGNHSASSLEEIWPFYTPGNGPVVVRTVNGEQWELGPCRKMLRHNTQGFQYEFIGNKSVESCSGYVFDHSQVEQSIVTEWDLVCEKEWLAKITQPTFMLGVLIGALLFGDVADRYAWLYRHVSQKRVGTRWTL